MSNHDHGDRPFTLEEMQARQAGPHWSDEQVASKVRMLMRDDLDHEAVCVMARDRIVYLSAVVAERDRQIAELPELKSIRGDFLEFVKKVSRATVTVPWEAGYGPEYAPTAGDPEKSISELIAIVRRQTAQECAEIAESFGITSQLGLHLIVAVRIREKFGLQDEK